MSALCWNKIKDKIRLPNPNYVSNVEGITKTTILILIKYYKLVIIIIFQ